MLWLVINGYAYGNMLHYTYNEQYKLFHIVLENKNSFFIYLNTINRLEIWEVDNSGNFLDKLDCYVRLENQIPKIKKLYGECINE